MSACSNACSDSSPGDSANSRAHGRSSNYRTGLNPPRSSGTLSSGELRLHRDLGTIGQRHAGQLQLQEVFAVLIFAGIDDAAHYGLAALRNHDPIYH